MLRPDTADSVMSLADLDLSIRATTPSAWRNQSSQSRVVTPDFGSRSSTPRTYVSTPSPSPVSDQRRNQYKTRSINIRSEAPKMANIGSLTKQPKRSASLSSTAVTVTGTVAISERPAWRGVSPKRVDNFNKAKSRPKPKKSKLRNRTDYVDESLFGQKKSVEAGHKELHDVLQTKPFWSEPSAKKSSSRQKARDHTRMDFTNPFCELPSGPKGDGRRFARTDTLHGAWDAARPAKPAKPPYKTQGATMLHHNKHRPSRTPTAPPARSLLVHESVPKPERRSKPPNNIWAHHPDV